MIITKAENKAFKFNLQALSTTLNKFIKKNTADKKPRIPDEDNILKPSLCGFVIIKPMPIKNVLKSSENSSNAD